MRKMTVALLGGALVLAATAVAWPFAVTHRLVRFPTNVDQHLTYKGSLVTYVDPGTGLNLSRPLSVPVTVYRHTYSETATYSIALVHDDVTVTWPGTSHGQVSVYALDRRSMLNVSAAGTTALVANNPVDRTGTYFVTLPMGLSPHDLLPLWKEETGRAYLVDLDRSVKMEGLELVAGQATVPMTPTTASETSILSGWGLPTALSPAQAAARLQAAAGVSVASVSATLAPHLNPSELATLSAALSAPVPLKAYAYGSGKVAAEPRTGTIVDASEVVDGRAVLPSSPQLSAALAVLEAHTDVPGVDRLVSALRTMTTRPQPVFALHYTETPASVASMVSYARSQASRLNLVSRDLPGGIIVLSIVLLAAGPLSSRRSSPAPGHSASEPEVEVHRIAA